MGWTYHNSAKSHAHSGQFLCSFKKKTIDVFHVFYENKYRVNTFVDEYVFDVIKLWSSRLFQFGRYSSSQVSIAWFILFVHKTMQGPRKSYQNSILQGEIILCQKLKEQLLLGNRWTTFSFLFFFCQAFYRLFCFPLLSLSPIFFSSFFSITSCSVILLFL